MYYDPPTEYFGSQGPRGLPQRSHGCRILLHVVCGAAALRAFHSISAVLSLQRGRIDNRFGAPLPPPPLPSPCRDSNGSPKCAFRGRATCIFRE